MKGESTVPSRRKKGLQQDLVVQIVFSGQVIRESSKSDSKTVARDAEKTRRRELEQAYNRIPKREKTPLFAAAAHLWLAGKCGLAESSRKRYKECVAILKGEFGKHLVCDFDGNDIAEYQRKRLAEGFVRHNGELRSGQLAGDSPAIWLVGTDSRPRANASGAPRRRRRFPRSNGS